MTEINGLGFSRTNDLIKFVKTFQYTKLKNLLPELEKIRNATENFVKICKSNAFGNDVEISNLDDILKNLKTFRNVYSEFGGSDDDRDEQRERCE